MKRTLMLICCGLVLLGNAMATVSTIYYQPFSGFCGDPMPFYDVAAGRFNIYYLHERRPNLTGTYHPVYALSTTNFCSYEVYGEVLPTGLITDQDAAIGTGSVVYNEANQTYYFFYTGNRHNPDASQDGQVVMNATSTDGIHWTKGYLYLAPSANGYYKNDFRDPDVFLAEDGLWHMLVSTGKNGKHVLVEYTSPDLNQWTHRGIFMPMLWDRFYECPDVFKMGDWWYMVYSELHKEIRRVQYFKATTYEGLKDCTRDDVPVWPDDHEGYLDSRGLYAAKTASDGTNRYIWGWCPTRANSNNTKTNNANGEPDWAGALVCHRLVQHEDGSLTLGRVNSIADRFTVTIPEKQTELTLTAGQQLQMAAMEDKNHLHLTVTTEGDNDDFGISLCHTSFFKKYYSLQIHSEGDGKRKVNFLEEGEGGMGFVPYIDSYFFEAPQDRIYDIDIYTDGTVLVLYINDNLCYTNRVYMMKNCQWGLNCYSGSVAISNIAHWNLETATAMEVVSESPCVEKKILTSDGQLLIVRDGKYYTMIGSMWK